MSFVDALSVASASLAAGAGAISAAAAARSVRQSNQAKARVQAVDLKSAIDALDRPALRRVLYDELGSVRVSDYTSNALIRDRFDVLIAEVAQFVAGPEETATPLPIPAEATSPRGRTELPVDLMRAETEIATGDAWAGLARLRRSLEIRLSAMLGDETKTREARGAGQQLRLLRNAGQIDDGWYNQLRYAVSVCNAAVHGDDVPPSQAAEVLDIVARWFELAES